MPRGAVDAITGEGMALAFRQAEALARAMVAEDLEGYEVEHRRIMRLPRVMSSALLWMGRSAGVRFAAMGVLGGDAGGCSRACCERMPGRRVVAADRLRESDRPEGRRRSLSEGSESFS